jgi:uncharacterized protein YecA (UPF0149 family)
MPDLQDLVSEYCGSDQFLFLDPMIKPHAEVLLSQWCQIAGDEINTASIDASLKKMATVDVPLEVKKALPHLLKAFFEHISSTGRLPQASQWIDTINLIEQDYINKFRDDGSVRGETFAKKYTDVGRNDPCPCGSGKKFKHCCMKLIA